MMDSNSKLTRLSRVPDALVPAALLGASALGRGDQAAVLYLCVLAVHLLSLGASHGVRAAFARQTSVRAVRGSVLCGGMLQITASIILVFLSYYLYDLRYIPWIIAGLSLNIEHMFYEYLCAMGDGYSAAMCHVLTALFTFAGLLLGTDGEAAFYAAVATSIPAAVSVVISLYIHGLSVRFNAQVIGRGPRAMIYSAFYPLAVAVIAALCRIKCLSVPFFAGLIVYAFCRTPYRRSRVESRRMNLLLFSLSVLAATCTVASSCFCKTETPQIVFTTCGALLLSSLCSFIAFGKL